MRDFYRNIIPKSLEHTHSIHQLREISTEKHKPAPPAQDLLTNPRSIFTYGQI